MEAPEKDAAICSACRHVSTCTYTKDSLRPVLFCNEHEPYDLRPARAGGTGNMSAAAVAKHTEANKGNPAKHLGLCQNCENRETCTFQKPESGMWHCSEYQ